MAEVKPDTHGVTINFGKHSGQLLTRVPLSYLRFMVRNKTPQSDMAQAEMERRGSTEMPEIELSIHAVDRASLRCMHIWRHSCKGNTEGIYSWLMRMALEALKYGGVKNGKIAHGGILFVIDQDGLYPLVKSVMLDDG